MKLHVKVPPPPGLPQGLIALVRTSQPPRAPTPQATEPNALAEPVEATRAWKPDRSLLQTEPQPPKNTPDLSLAADEQTIVGRINLKDPSLFRSQPPPALVEDAKVEGVEAEASTIEFVGSLSALNRDDAQPTTASVWGEEKTQLYRPQRSHLAQEEITDEYDATEVVDPPTLSGPEPPRVIIASGIVAESAADPTRSEATKKKRRRRPNTDTKLGLYLCVLGSVALVFSAAWRHPRTAPVAHDAVAKVATVAASLLGR